MSTSDKYRSAIHQLAPTGLVWPTPAEDSNLGKLWGVLGDALLNLQTEADDTLDQLFPDSEGIFLDQWHSILGFPRCGLELTLDREKKDANLAMLTASPYSNKQFFIDIAAALGFSITVEDKNDDPSLGAFEFRVSAAAVLPDDLYFRCGLSRAGDPLVSGGARDALECIIEEFKPAHTTVVFNYQANLLLISGDNMVTIAGDNLIA